MAVPNVDAYIDKSAEFARPILKHVRELIHQGCPDLEEAIKWSTPAFLYKGKILYSMAAFKEHCRVIFWRPELAKVLQEDGLEADADAAFLPKITTVKELPPKATFLRYISECRRLADESPARVRMRPAKPKPAVEMPAELASALKGKKAASANFEKFPPSHKREYMEWIAEAKRPETREKRVKDAVSWIAGGKPRNWKYMNC